MLNLLATEANEILVQEAKIYATTWDPEEYAFIHELNNKMGEVLA
jgi:hypothetical protein